MLLQRRILPAATKGDPMEPSSVLCRAQEAHHYNRAVSATLENVRTIAAKAAIAWAIQAQTVERREGRRNRRRIIANIMAIQKQHSGEGNG